VTSIDDVGPFPLERVPKHVRFVVCLTCDEGLGAGTVMQRRDAAGAWRPDPPMCAACLERNAEQAEEWYERRAELGEAA